MITSNDTTCINQIDFLSADSFRYAVEIYKPMGVLDAILAWCRRDLIDPDWRWQLVSTSGLDVQGRYIFYFNNEQDYFMFVLRWR
jgi:hypothetical protein